MSNLYSTQAAVEWTALSVLSTPGSSSGGRRSVDQGLLPFPAGAAAFACMAPHLTNLPIVVAQCVLSFLDAHALASLARCAHGRGTRTIAHVAAAPLPAAPSGPDDTAGSTGATLLASPVAEHGSTPRGDASHASDTTAPGSLPSTSGVDDDAVGHLRHAAAPGRVVSSARQPLLADVEHVTVTPLASRVATTVNPSQEAAAISMNIFACIMPAAKSRVVRALGLHLPRPANKAQYYTPMFKPPNDAHPSQVIHLPSAPAGTLHSATPMAQRGAAAGLLPEGQVARSAGPTHEHDDTLASSNATLSLPAAAAAPSGRTGDAEMVSTLHPHASVLDDFPRIHLTTLRSGHTQLHNWCQAAAMVERWSSMRRASMDLDHALHPPVAATASTSGHVALCGLDSERVMFENMCKIREKVDMLTRVWPHTSLYYSFMTVHDWDMRMGWRRRLVVWLHALCDHFTVPPAVYADACVLADRYTYAHGCDMRPTQMQLAYLTSLTIAARVHKMTTAIINNLKSIAPDYTSTEYVEMEAAMVKVMGTTARSQPATEGGSAQSHVHSHSVSTPATGSGSDTTAHAAAGAAGAALSDGAPPNRRAAAGESENTPASASTVQAPRASTPAAAAASVSAQSREGGVPSGPRTPLLPTSPPGVCERFSPAGEACSIPPVQMCVQTSTFSIAGHVMCILTRSWGETIAHTVREALYVCMREADMGRFSPLVLAVACVYIGAKGHGFHTSSALRSWATLLSECVHIDFVSVRAAVADILTLAHAAPDGVQRVAALYQPPLRSGASAHVPPLSPGARTHFISGRGHVWEDDVPQDCLEAMTAGAPALAHTQSDEEPDEPRMHVMSVVPPTVVTATVARVAAAQPLASSTRSTSRPTAQPATRSDGAVGAFSTARTVEGATTDAVRTTSARRTGWGGLFSGGTRSSRVAAPDSTGTGASSPPVVHDDAAGMNLPAITAGGSGGGRLGMLYSLFTRSRGSRTSSDSVGARTPQGANVTMSSAGTGTMDVAHTTLPAVVHDDDDAAVRARAVALVVLGRDDEGDGAEPHATSMRVARRSNRGSGLPAGVAPTASASSGTRLPTIRFAVSPAAEAQQQAPHDARRY